VPQHVTRWLAWAGKLGATAAATWLILRAVGLRLTDLDNVDLSAVDPAGGLLTLSVAVLLVAFGVAALLWNSLVGALGGETLTARQALAVVLVANLGRYLPGKVFQLAGLTWLGRRLGIPGAVGAAAAVVGQGLHLVAALLLGGGLVYGAGLLPGAGNVAMIVAALAVLAFLSWPGALPLAVRTLRRRRPPEDPERPSVPEPPRRSFLPWILGYLVNWLVFGAGFHLLARGLGLQVPLLLATTAFAAAYLLGYLALFAPAGLGVREGFLVAFLGPSVGPGPALTLAAVQRIWMTGAELIGAALMWPALKARAPGGGASPS
jgi:uncharacterized membrane protein YbhN (UPF0104 family)